MKGSVLGRRYAGALLSIGVKDGKADDYGEQLNAAAESLGVGEPLKILLSPLFEAEFKQKLLNDVSSEMDLAPAVKNLLNLLLDKHRFVLLASVAESYQDLLDQHLNRIQALVVSAVPLDQATLARMRVLLQRKLGQKIVLTARTDPAVIGGLRIEVGSKVYDATLADHLFRINELLKHAG